MQSAPGELRSRAALLREGGTSASDPGRGHTECAHYFAFPKLI